MNANPLNPVLAEYIAAVNAFDLERLMATFAPDALVNDVQREFVGVEAIRRWAAKEIIGDRVTMEVREVLNRGDETVVRALYDGDYDKTNLPKELILTGYFSVRAGKVRTLIILRNREVGS